VNRRRKGLVFLLSLVVIAGISIAAASAYQASPRRGQPMIYSEKDMLQELWSSYKKEYVESGSNRTLDKQRQNISTSEGQSYTMLRAVWMDDKKTFDDSWKWTKDNLQRDDYLMAWKFGKLTDGNYGIMESDGGQNTATDGDSDIALSLLMAYSRWKDDDYLYDAQPIIASIWEKEVVSIDDRPVLVANDIERNNEETVIVNPSYFSPYAYKIFAHMDKEHDWKGLADNSYELLARIGRDKLGARQSSGLPPDWVLLDRYTGELLPTEGKDLPMTYGFDAMRTPWRLALDYKWFKDDRSKALLQDYKLLADEWTKYGRIMAIYSRAGAAGANYQSSAAYGTAMGYFSVIKPGLADDIYRTRLASLYDPDKQMPSTSLSYYDANWAWFGIALYHDELPDLTAKEN
jgi:endoglucanase